MTTKQMLQAGLVVSGAALGAAGAAFIEPLVIGIGVVAAGLGAVMRFNDKHEKSEVQRAHDDRATAVASR
jgi:hypothetical protein